MLTDLNSNESKRRLAIDLLKNPDEGRDEALKKYTDFVCLLLKMPMSFVSILDDKNQYIKHAQNIAATETNMGGKFCEQTLKQGEIFICADTHQHPIFHSDQAVRGAPYVRFYAGCPLTTRDGVPLGTLSVLDTQPRELSVEQIDIFKTLAGLISDFMASWYSIGYIDVVTLLPNRQRLLKDIEVSAAENFRLVIIDCIDMPFAYEIARSLGMIAVENLLRDMTVELQARLPLASKLYAVAVGRFAFLTALPMTLSLEDIAQRLQGIQARMNPEVPLDLNIHMGDSGLCDNTLTPNEILRRAVSALHEAISQGLSVTNYNDELDRRKQRDFSLLTELRQTLQGNLGLYLVYQPKISLATGLVTGAEALVRWKHPKNGEVLPAEFIPLVEKTSLMRELTAWVIDHAIVQLRAWRDLELFIPVSINLAASDFSRPDFSKELEQKLLDACLDTAMLGVECLETERMLESPAALNGLHMLKKRGFTISLDDFGSGYSNINYLHKIPLDIIKLDRSIVGNIANETSSRIIVQNVIRLLKQLNYIVLAEGVEDATTVQILRDLGCDEVQGYFYARPMTPVAFEAWYQARNKIQGKIP